MSNISYIVSGGVKGTDTLAENFAKAHNIQTIVYKPQWKKYGKRAGILRNQDIVAESDVVVVFWDGSSKGTKSIIEIVKKLNKQIFIQKTESNIREEQSEKLPLSKNKILKMTRKTSKDATHHLFNRYIWLVDTLYRHPRLSLEQINDLWQQASINDSEEEFPKRTFHNHRKAIEEMFGILIECDRQDGYEYYIRNHKDIKRATNSTTG